MALPPDPVGIDVTLAVIQGMTSLSNATANTLIDSLQHDADRYRILVNRIRDFAEDLDSRRAGIALHRLVYRVTDLDRDAASAAAEDIKNNLWSN
jgi:nitrogen-specific signal transduction histidine kinase